MWILVKDCLTLRTRRILQFEFFAMTNFASSSRFDRTIKAL